MRLIIVSSIVFCATLSAAADVVSIDASRDNTLYEHAEGGLSNGAGMHMFVGRNSQNLIRRALIRFDVAANVPAGATIVSATLRLHMSQGQEGARDVALHRLLADWGEGASDAPGSEGGGAPAEPGDATWIHRFFDTETWYEPGGDFSPTSSAITAIAGPGFYEWRSAATAEDVQGWLDAPDVNFGWAMLGDEREPSTARRFDTRENPTEDFRPELIVEFRPVPAPSAAVVLVLGTLVRRRRRR